ncbi:MAG TPA: alpha/beta hydrolase [Pyrinomonadaceae bacterium]
MNRSGLAGSCLAVAILFLVSASSISSATTSNNSPSLQPAELSGYWTGTAAKDGSELSISVDFSPDGKTYRGLFSATQTGLFEAPLNEVQFKSPQIRFELSSEIGKSSFEGEIRADEISGQWQFRNLSGTFKLKRVEAPKLPYTTEAVQFRNAGITFGGTLRVPQEKGQHPALIFLHGSGAQSRQSDAFLADQLARSGIATLTFDKRGVGASQAKSWNASFKEYAEDALAAVKLLQGHARIKPQRIGLYGPSQGAWIASLAASMSRDVAFIIVRSGGGITPVEQEQYRGRQLLRKQGFSETEIDEALRFRKLKYDLVITGKGNEEFESTLAEVKQRKWFPHVRENLPAADFWKPNGYYDPIPVWQRVQCPVLGLFGERDESTPTTETVEKIRSALQTASNKDFTLKVFPLADHGLIIWPEPIGPFKWFTLAPAFVETLSSWVVSHGN